MTNTSITNIRKDRWFLFVMNSILNYAVVLQLQYGVSFAEARIEDVVEGMMPSR